MKVEFNKMVECPWTEKKVKKIIDIAAKAVAAVGEVEVNIIGEKLIKKLSSAFSSKSKKARTPFGNSLSNFQKSIVDDEDENY